MVKIGLLRRLFQFKDGDREAVESFISSLGIDTAQKDFQDVLNGVFGEEKMIDDAVNQAVLKEKSLENTEEIPAEAITEAAEDSAEKETVSESAPEAIQSSEAEDASM